MVEQIVIKGLSAVGVIIGLILQVGRSAEPIGRAIAVEGNEFFVSSSKTDTNQEIPDLNTLIKLRNLDKFSPFRTDIEFTYADYIQLSKHLGYSDEIAKMLYALSEYGGIGLERALQYESNNFFRNQLVEPIGLITLHRRYPELLSEEELHNTLHLHGYSTDTINQLMKISEVFPSPDDMIRFAVREVYSREIVEKYKMHEDYPVEFEKEFKKLGGSEELAKQYWAGHWVLPSPSEGYEFLHRFDKDVLDLKLNKGMIDPTEYNELVFTKEDLKVLLRTLDVMPYWRTRMREISYLPLSRIDVRRAWEMGAIDDDELYINCRELGYSHKNAEILTQFTILERSLPSLKDAYIKGWITKEEFRKELINLGIKENIVERIYRRVVKAEEPKRLEKERDLTKTEILKGFKNNILTEKETIELLRGMGYDEYEAEYILEINKVVAKGDPENYSEAKRLVEFYKKTLGKQATEISPESIQLENEIKEMRKKLIEIEKTASIEEITELKKNIASKQERLNILLIGS